MYLVNFPSDIYSHTTNPIIYKTRIYVMLVLLCRHTVRVREILARFADSDIRLKIGTFISILVKII